MRISHSSVTAASILLFGLGLLAPAVSNASVEVQAHRGGTIVEGVPTFPEASMAAFEHSLEKRFTIEFDLQPTSDGHAIVMHDENLDRTTNCTGAVDDHTLAQLGSCRIDVLGSGSNTEALPPGDSRLEPIPTLAEMIDLLEKTGGKANIEVKDLAGEHPSFAPDTYKLLEASDIPSNRITVQNFLPGSLTTAPSLYPGVATSFLSLAFLNDSAVAIATDQGFTQVSPQWPISAEFVAEARAAGLTIAPFTIDDAEGIEAADALGVDAVITNDPTLADRLAGHRPNLALRVVRGPSKARPGGTIKIGSFVLNLGKGQSEEGARVSIKFNRKSLKPAGKISKTVPSLGWEEEFDTNFKLKVRRGAKRFGRFPVTLRLTEAGKPTIKKVVKVRVLRPRK